ncbi:MAG TPA: bifunctional DNA primase/polymerase [Gemmataceae bacterium]|jgi:hypothetical protein|nr:bifunctional DNA primase/polymerase [Gemmataceae bacterium]
METPRNALAVAFDALHKGIVPLPCYPGTKLPMVRWKEWQHELPPEELIREWFRFECNIAILTTGMVVFDCDDPDEADQVVIECGETLHRLKTPRGGFHLGYRRRKGVKVGNAVKIKGRAIDLRTDGGMEMIPPSFTEDDKYEWITDGPLPLIDLPVACVGWTRERSRKKTRAVLTIGPPAEGSIRFPEAYALRVMSIQGSNGSRGLVRMVCIMRDAGRTPKQTLDYALGPWNAACAVPPWTEKEIRHAIRRHYGIADF